MLKLDRHMDSDEKLMLSFRPSRKAYIMQYLGIMLIFAVGFLFLYFRHNAAAEALKTINLGLAWLSFIFGLILLGRLEYRIWSRTYALTSERILYSRGIFSEKFKSSHYNYITDVMLNQTLWDKMMNTGTVVINTAGSDKYEIKYRKISDPFKIERMINDLTGKATQAALQAQTLHPAHAAMQKHKVYHHKASAKAKHPEE